MFAQPDGSWSVDAAAEPVRVLDDEGQWQDIDTTLVSVDGGYAPRWADSDLVLSDGGDTVFAALTQDGRDLGWKWTGTLPKPVVDGSTATYVGVAPGDGDLVVTATSTGFSYDVVLNSEPKPGTVLRVPVVTDGARLKEAAGGGVEIVASGESVISAPAPVMWDAETDSEGDPVNLAPVDTMLGATASGTPTMVLTPDAGFLSDPDTVYPVTVDPSFTDYTSGDAWLQTPDFTSAQVSSAQLRVGTKDAGAKLARAFLHFNGVEDLLAGAKVLSSSLVLSNYDSGSCAAGDIQAARLTSAWTTAMTWSNQPSATGSNAATYGPAKGYSSSCPAGDATWDLTAMTQQWSDGTANYGIRLKAVDETSSNTFRRYRSNDYGGSERPHLLLSYNSYPTTPKNLVAAPGQTGYVRSATPTVSATVSDPDAGLVSAVFSILNSSGTEIWTTTTSAVSSGSTVSASVPSGKLSEGATYTLRVKGTDGSLSSGWASTSIKYDSTAPAVPSISSTKFTDGGWLATTPTSSGSFTFSSASASDVDHYEYRTDAKPVWLSGVPGIDSSTYTFTPAKAFNAGYHTVEARTVDKAGNVSASKVFGFGSGSPGVVAPATAMDTTGALPLEWRGASGATAAAWQWRRAGESAWNAASQITSGASTWNGSLTATSPMSTVTGLIWNLASETDPATSQPITAPAVLEVRGCLTISGAQQCSATRTVQLQPSGFGSDAPVAAAGPASVALNTGEMMLGGGDVADGTVGLGRTFSSLDVATLTGGVFGPGWTSSLTTVYTDASTATVLDQRGTGGSAGSGGFALVYPDGTTANYAPTGSGGVYEPVDEDESSDTRRLTLDTSASPQTLTLVEDQGATTVWKLTSSTWLLDHVTGPEQTGTVSYQRDANNRVIWMAQGAPSGVTCNANTQQPGCTGFKINYAGTGSAVRVSSVQQVTYDPKPVTATGLPGSGAGMTTTTVASYTYDTSNRLSAVCDPRPATALCTGYTYTTLSTGRTVVATMAPPGQTAWRFGYNSAGRLATIKRAVDAATGTGDATWTIVYNPSMTAAGLPDMSTATAASWGQETAPTAVAAVFGPNRVPASTPTSSDWPYATLYYTDATGRVTNTGSYGAGAWQLDTIWYDESGNTSRTLDPAGRANALAQPTAQRAATAYAGSSLIYYSADGTRTLDEYGPAHTATLQDGTTGLYRAHTHYVYDDDPVGASLDTNRPALPAGETSFGLVMEEQHSAADADMAADHDIRLVRYEYSPNATGDGNGWDLAIPTRILLQTESGWNTTVTRFDPQGRTIETRQPGGASSNGVGTDAHATTFVYYTSGANAADSACGNKPQWADLTCRVGPAAQPAGNPMPVTYTTGYSLDRQPTRTEDRSGSTTRTAISAYDSTGRVTSTSTTISGGNGTDPTLPTTTYGYDTSTGLPTTQTASGATITAGYDTWGRAKTYTDALGTSSTATYDTAGRLKTRNDSLGTYTYTYDTSTEHRGLPTSVDVGLSTGADVFTYAYNPAGAPAAITYPNTTTATYGYDQTGTPVSLSYTSGGTTFLGFTATADVDGRVLGYTSPASTQAYTYDNLGRLTTTQDTRAGGCTTRTYGFSAASERTNYNSYAPASGVGACQTTTPTATKTSTYDTANRITTSGYTYDNLGRTRTTPAADTAPGATGALNATYYPNDMAASLTQAVDNGAGGSVTKATSYGLDPTGRINTITNTTAGTETNRLRYRFPGSSDSPSRIDTSTDAGSSWTSTRYLQLPSLGMAGAVSNSTATLQLANLHGDIVATQTNTTSTTTSGYTEADEYGNTITGTPGRYGWLGAQQRSTDTVGGLTLMGARLYNSNTGLFTSTDLVRGGNVTAYAYPIDPVNDFDLNGKYSYSFWYAIMFRPFLRVESVRNSVVNAFGSVFPFPNSCSRLIYGGVCRLAGAGPVRVIGLWATGFTFMSMPGHVEGPYKTISFSFSRRYGMHFLHVWASGADTTGCQKNTLCRSLNYVAAYGAWRAFAALIANWWQFK